MAIYRIVAHDSDITHVHPTKVHSWFAHALAESKVFAEHIWDGTPMAVVPDKGPQLSLCVHDNDKITKATVGLLIDGQMATIKVIELLQAIALSSRRKLIVTEQGAHLIGGRYGSAETVLEAGQQIEQLLDEAKREDEERNAQMETFVREHGLDALLHGLELGDANPDGPAADQQDEKKQPES